MTSKTSPAQTLSGDVVSLAAAASPRETPLRPTVAPAGLYCAWGTRKRPLFVSTENSGITTAWCCDRRAENVTETFRVNVPLIIVMLLDWPS